MKGSNVHGGTERRGIACAGNWIVDRVKRVDRLPGRGMLANIRSEEEATGGSPANVLMDLARLGASFPLAGLGVVGDDADGRLILARAREHRIDMSLVAVTSEARTSYTDVMSEDGAGERVFFHHRGANALFGPEHVPLERLSCRIFHLGYLLLLDRMDERDAEYGTTAARLLHELRALGIRTSVDVVSEESDRFRALVPPALRQADYVILNEIEAGRTTGRPARRDDGSLDAGAVREAAHALLGLGSMELVTVHMPEGWYACDRAGGTYSRGSLVLPQGFIVSAVGAGDAFCAGMLYGLHEGWDIERAGRLGTCAAGACLSAANTTDGVGCVADVLALGDRFDERPAPVSV